MDNTLYTCERHALTTVVYMMQEKGKITCPLCTAEERIKELEDKTEKLEYALDDAVAQRDKE